MMQPSSNAEGEMRAWIQSSYGGPEALRVQQVRKPTPGHRQVRVRMVTASVHVGDYLLVCGRPYAARFATGWPSPRQRSPGTDVAGVIDAAGPEISGLRVGDAVVASSARGEGGCAEYAVYGTSEVVRKPAGLGFVQAAALPVSGLAALHALRDVAAIRPGQRILILGATGGVGLYAVQLARAMGGEVAAEGLPEHAALLLSVGAHRIVDHATADLQSDGSRYDIILDNVGRRPFTQLQRVLTPRGVVIPNSGRAGLSYMLAAFARSLVNQRQARPYLSRPNAADLQLLTGAASRGALRAIIDRVYSFEEAADAITHVGRGRASGKVIVEIMDTSS